MTFNVCDYFRVKEFTGLPGSRNTANVYDGLARFKLSRYNKATEKEDKTSVVCLGVRRQNGDSFLLYLYFRIVHPSGVHISVHGRVR